MAVKFTGNIDIDGVAVTAGGSNSDFPNPPGGGTGPSNPSYAYVAPQPGGSDQYVGSTTVDPTATLVSMGYNVGDNFVLYGATVISGITSETTLQNVIDAVQDPAVQAAINEHFGTKQDTFYMFVNADKKLVIQRTRNKSTGPDGNPSSTDPDSGNEVPDTTQRLEMEPPGNDDAFGKTGLIYQTDVVAGTGWISTRRFQKTDLLSNFLSTSIRPAYFGNSLDFHNTDIPNDGLPVPRDGLPAVGTPGMTTVQDLIDYLNNNPEKSEYQPESTYSFDGPFGPVSGTNPAQPGQTIQIGAELLPDGRLHIVSYSNYEGGFVPRVCYQGINQYAPFNNPSAWDLLFDYHLIDVSNESNYSGGGQPKYLWTDENGQRTGAGGVYYPVAEQGVTVFFDDTLTRTISKTVNNV